MAKLSGFKEKIALSTWIREAMIDSEKTGPITALACMHIVGATEILVDNVKIVAGLWTPELLERRFIGKAETESQALDGVQLFRMLAFYEGSTEPLARFHFRVNGDLDSADGLNSESGDAKGMFAQGMRHIEAITQMTFRKDAELHNASQGIMSMLARQNVDLMEKQVEYMAAITSLVTKVAEGQHQGRMDELKLGAQLEERKMLMGMAPHLLNTIAGSDVVPQANLDTELIDRMAENITESQFQMMVSSGIIPQNMVGVVAARMQKHLKNKLEAQLEHKRLAEASDPEEDAGGGVH